ncbi:MAG TPA: nuclear transport factor 2 family protein [Solirubrobacteraceae bacterium]|nr:nuclear transport factor 2 family protein [Solirubrobacteraceae bacterium]
MGETNAQIVEAAYKRFEQLGSPESTLVGPGFVWDMTHMASWPEQRLFEGRDGMLQFLAEWTASWEDWRLEVDAIHERGDKVVALCHQHGRSKASGLEVEMVFAQVWTMRDGQYRRMEMYSDIDNAFADAGIRL